MLRKEGNVSASNNPTQQYNQGVFGIRIWGQGSVVSRGLTAGARSRHRWWLGKERENKRVLGPLAMRREQEQDYTTKEWGGDALCALFFDALRRQ